MGASVSYTKSPDPIKIAALPQLETLLMFLPRAGGTGEDKSCARGLDAPDADFYCALWESGLVP